MERIEGYVNYGFDAVVKFGGSLLATVESTVTSVRGIEKAYEADKKVLVIPGGGPTDKAIESLNSRRALAPDTHHHACARAQDQTGLIIADPAYSSLLKTCETLADARKLTSQGFIPVLLPSRIIFALDPFERTWDITSDGIAVWFAWLVSAPVVMVLTDVDGIYPQGSVFSGSPLPSISAKTLCSWGNTSIDRCVSAFALARGIRVWVGNGNYSDRLLSALLGQQTIGTFVEP